MPSTHFRCCVASALGKTNLAGTDVGLGAPLAGRELARDPGFEPPDKGEAKCTGTCFETALGWRDRTGVDDEAAAVGEASGDAIGDACADEVTRLVPAGSVTTSRCVRAVGRALAESMPRPRVSSVSSPSSSSESDVRTRLTPSAATAGCFGGV